MVYFHHNIEPLFPISHVNKSAYFLCTNVYLYCFCACVLYVSDFSVYVLIMFCIRFFCYAETFGVWSLVVGPGALKPSVGDGIESRRPLTSP